MHILVEREKVNIVHSFAPPPSAIFTAVQSVENMAELLRFHQSPIGPLAKVRANRHDLAPSPWSSFLTTCDVTGSGLLFSSGLPAGHSVASSAGNRFPGPCIRVAPNWKESNNQICKNMKFESTLLNINYRFVKWWNCSLIINFKKLHNKIIINLNNLVTWIMILIRVIFKIKLLDTIYPFFTCLLEAHWVNYEKFYRRPSFDWFWFDWRID